MTLTKGFPVLADFADLSGNLTDHIDKPNSSYIPVPGNGNMVVLQATQPGSKIATPRDRLNLFGGPKGIRIKRQEFSKASEPIGEPDYWNVPPNGRNVFGPKTATPDGRSTTVVLVSEDLTPVTPAITPKTPETTKTTPPTPPVEQSTAAPSAWAQFKVMMISQAIPGVPNYVPTVVTVGGIIAVVAYLALKK
ncbi:Uncharacterised protein [uncultured archaeon]|nr:Uncharacterised protein [uncultured archaeon]